MAHAGWPRKGLYSGALKNKHSTHTECPAAGWEARERRGAAGGEAAREPGRPRSILLWDLPGWCGKVAVSLLGIRAGAERDSARITQRPRTPVLDAACLFSHRDYTPCYCTPQGLWQSDTTVQPVRTGWSARTRDCTIANTLNSGLAMHAPACAPSQPSGWGGKHFFAFKPTRNPNPPAAAYGGYPAPPHSLPPAPSLRPPPLLRVWPQQRNHAKNLARARDREPGR